jgi:hypothetical protein
VTSTLENKTDPYFCRIEGSEGYITVEGFAAANPKTFTVYPKTSISFSEGKVRVECFPGEVHNLETEGKGYYWQADAVAWISQQVVKRTQQCHMQRRSG